MAFVGPRQRDTEATGEPQSHGGGPVAATAILKPATLIGDTPTNEYTLTIPTGGTGYTLVNWVYTPTWANRPSGLQADWPVPVEVTQGNRYVYLSDCRVVQLDSDGVLRSTIALWSFFGDGTSMKTAKVHTTTISGKPTDWVDGDKIVWVLGFKNTVGNDQTLKIKSNQYLSYTRAVDEPRGRWHNLHRNRMRRRIVAAC